MKRIHYKITKGINSPETSLCFLLLLSLLYNTISYPNKLVKIYSLFRFMPEKQLKEA